MNKRWILKEKQILPLSNTILANKNNEVLRKVNYIYECPYCHNTITCNLTNKLTIRKCRYCNNSVSPYKGEIIENIWIKEE